MQYTVNTDKKYFYSMKIIETEKYQIASHLFECVFSLFVVVTCTESGGDMTEHPKRPFIKVLNNHSLTKS